MSTVQEEILQELQNIRKDEKDIKRREQQVLRKLDIDLHKDKFKQRKLFYEVSHFRYGDFSQIVIGCSVFSLPAFINTSFWDYLPEVHTYLLVGIHLFFALCVLLALNFEYRDDINLQPWFGIMLLKRFFYTYFSVMMVVILLLVLVNKLTYSVTLLEVFRNFIAAQSVGLFGAVTFSFLKK